MQMYAIKLQELQGAGGLLAGINWACYYKFNHRGRLIRKLFSMDNLVNWFIRGCAIGFILSLIGH